MSYPVLARRDTALDDAETAALLRDRLGDGVLGDLVEYGELTIQVASSSWHAAVATCRDDQLLAFDLFDCLFGVDGGVDGIDVVAILYSTSKGRRILLRTRCEGGRDAPELDSVVDLYIGANWHEREAFDMFGIDFPGHPGILPRILCVENFEGWPLRKEFPLASRVAKPWPGVKDPAEPDEDGNVVVREPAVGEAPGPSGLDEIIARQAREANPGPEPEIDADKGASGGAAASNASAEAPEREEVQLDQETYDRLIADGKSERIARSKAKAAFIKQQRAAERATAEAAGPDAGAVVDEEAPAGEVTEGEREHPDGDVGGGTEGRTAGQAAPPPGDGTPASIDTAASDGVDVDAAAAAREAAETARADQATAREARAAEQAGPHDDADVTPIPSGTPPPDDAVAEGSDPDDDQSDDANGTDEPAGGTS